MKGSPGGILLIALGVIFLNLGWTGRISAVLDALKNGASDTGAPSGDTSSTPSGDGNQAADNTNKLPQQPDNLAQIALQNADLIRNSGLSMASFPGNKTTCAAGYVAVRNIQNQNVQACAREGAIPTGWMRLGVAGEANLNVIRTPAGGFSILSMPNGSFHA